ncbi:hypothetical protein [Lacticaseibacillus mingshuiensis]|uniref:Uncharacterized protein n=1 Tax=Lacticaseibacillus mingshuiensis TaxID=2799574 RepID=A0ABW4CJG6_9LACO|nr:hypothetical protein [Lacticaseibacillus mingshuiensis]
MPLTFLPEETVQAQSRRIADEVRAALGMSRSQNDYIGEAALPGVPAIQISLAQATDPDRFIRFYDDTQASSVPTSGVVVIHNDIIALGLNDGIKDTYLMLVRDGKLLRNLKLEQAIYSGPEFVDLVANVLPN